MYWKNHKIWDIWKHLSHDMKKPTKWVCAQRDPDQPGHLPSLIRVFAVLSMGSLAPKLSSCGQRILWSDWANAQADLSLRWAHTHFVGFVMSWLIFVIMLKSAHIVFSYSKTSKRHRRTGKQCRPWAEAIWSGSALHVFAQTSKYMYYEILLRRHNTQTIFEPEHDKSNKITCTPSEDSDQPGHLASLSSLCCPHEESLGP